MTIQVELTKRTLNSLSEIILYIYKLGTKLRTSYIYSLYTHICTVTIHAELT